MDIVFTDRELDNMNVLWQHGTTTVAEVRDAPVVWVVDPARETIVAHDQSGIPRVLHVPASLEIPDLLPGFSLDTGRLFTEY